MMRYSGVAPCQGNQGKRTHVAARPVTPEPTTATRIVSTTNRIYRADERR
jgi:hypothetical protein